MAIDARIPLMAQAPQMDNPMDIFARGASLKNALQTNQINQQTIEQNQMVMAESRERMRRNREALGIVDKYDGDVEKAMPELLSTIGAEAYEWADEERKRKEELSKLSADQAKNARDGMEFFEDRIKSIAGLPPEIRGQAYQRELQLLGQMAGGNEQMQPFIQSLPPAWDDELFADAQMDLERKKTALENQIREQELESKKTKEAREAELHPSEMRKAAAEAEEAERGKLLTPDEEAQEIRLAKAKRAPKETASKEEEDYKYWQTLTRDANRRLTEENQARIEGGENPATTPSGTELERLEKSEAGPGVRRWGAGQKMPRWLAMQYLDQAKGDKQEASRMAQTDGWDIR